jgi:hypothetical protein
MAAYFLAYQNYDIKYYLDTVISGITIKQEFPGTTASFIGYKTYIKNLTIKTQTLPVNANKVQGFWALKQPLIILVLITLSLHQDKRPGCHNSSQPDLRYITNTGRVLCCYGCIYSRKLKITGTETSDIVIEVSLSTNKSFEWTEVVNDGRWEPGKGEQVVDMGIRGMIPKIR